MADIEKVIDDIEEQIAWIRENDFHKFPGWGHAVLAMKDALNLLKEQKEKMEHLNNITLEYEKEVFRLQTLLKEQEAVKPQDAEMLIIHNGGAEEYVKDIESIVLLARKDYDIVYCGTFGRSVK